MGQEQGTSREESNEGTHQLRLFDQSGAVLPHGIHNTHGGLASEAGLRFAGDQQGVHEGLGVVLSNSHQQVVNQTPDWLHCRVDASNHLYNQARAPCHCMGMVEGEFGHCEQP